MSLTSVGNAHKKQTQKSKCSFALSCRKAVNAKDIIYTINAYLPPWFSPRGQVLSAYLLIFSLRLLYLFAR